MPFFSDLADRIREWGRSSPRLFTFIAGLFFGTIVAAIFSSIFFYLLFGGHTADFKHGLFILEPFAFSAAFIAALSIRNTTLTDPNCKFDAQKIGFLSVFISTFLVSAVYGILNNQFLVKSSTNLFIQAGLELAAFFAFIFGINYLILFIPEVVGAWAGYLVWRFLRRDAL